MKLARPADPSRLYLPRSKGGLALPSINALYQKQRASLACQILTSTDPTVRHTATLGIRREEELSRPKFKPMTVARDTWQKDPSANRKALTRRTKATIMENDAQRRLQHARGLEHQGQLLRATEDKASDIWSSAVQQLPPQVLSFSLNAAQDTLPHNANLALWRKKDGLSDACKLCGEKQTLPHVLNQCPTALNLRRYNTRHDSVLKEIEQGVRLHLSEGECLLADLPDYQPYTFPPHITHTDLRPDLVLWNNEEKTVCVIELTICYETRFEEAHILKKNKYADLIEAIEATEFIPELITLEVGSRGPYNPAGFNDLRAHITIPQKAWKHMLTNITRTVIVESHKIWTKRNWKDSLPSPSDCPT